MDAARSQLVALFLEGIPVHEPQDFFEAGMMGQLRQPRAARRYVGHALRRHEIAAAEFRGVAAEAAGSAVDEMLSDSTADGIADCAIGGRRRPVLEHGINRAVEVREIIRRADDAHGHQGLRDAGAGANGVGAHAAEILDFEAEYPSFPAHGDAGSDAMLPGMGIAHEGFEPVGDEPDWAADQLRHGSDRYLVRIE